MRNPRIYIDQDLNQALEQDSLITLDENGQRHVAQVLRLKAGAVVTLFDGRGGEYQATLTQVSRHSVCAHLDSFDVHSRQSPLAITLAQGISRGDKMDYTLQKATELGVHHIVPLTTERCGVHLNEERRHKRQRHWQGIITAACQQSGRDRLPQLQPINPLTQWLAQSNTPMKLVLDPEAHQTFRDLKPPEAGVELLIGPEGGLDADEIKLAQRHGYQTISIGPRILRTETAGIATLAIIQTLWGDI